MLEQDGSLLGSAHEHIPAFEVSYEESQPLINMINQGNVVYLQATLDISNEDNSVEVDLWYATSLDLGLHLSDELSALSLTFSQSHKQKSLFTPRIATYSCPDCDKQFKEDNCVTEGKYCAFTPSFLHEYGLDNNNFKMTGRDLLVQALREKCLHKIMTEKYQDEGDLFLTFLTYIDKCFVLSDEKANSLDACYDWSTV